MGRCNPIEHRGDTIGLSRSRTLRVWALVLLARGGQSFCFCLGFIVAAEADRHIRVALHLKLLPPKGRLMMLTLADTLWLAFNAVVIWHGYHFTVSMFEFPYISQTTGINLVWVQMIVPLGFVFISIRVFQVMIARWRDDFHLHDARVGD